MAKKPEILIITRNPGRIVHVMLSDYLKRQRRAAEHIGKILHESAERKDTLRFDVCHFRLHNSSTDSVLHLSSQFEIGRNKTSAQVRNVNYAAPRIFHSIMYSLVSNIRF